ncbi:TatD family hydrolase [Thalassospira sp. MCCC 1A01428]|uniref:TatD family hydrolase n=1 Tax=unclassified Thalassospira TaxID=2648997 RepID=UPI000A1DCE6C|nr:TatD family hydrolase [Thalassospira sp. MCCC 1A01428]OSQ42292.1 LuxR family transcriptional regulator [Thalassospira sp. MCCC 1A01428]
MNVALVDSHCHLDYPQFSDDFAGTMARARNAGVGMMVSIGVRISTFDQVRAMAERADNIYCTVGVHPHEAGEEGLSSPDILIEKTKDPKVIGIGESGLDYFYDNAPRDAQQQSFRAHIAACRETQLPLIVHTRDADDDTMDILEEEYAKGAFPGVIHCFSSSAELAQRALKIGFYISCSGIITFNSAKAIRDAVADVPLDRLIVETDSPYLAPVPKRGKSNEPSFVAHTAVKLAEIKGVSIEEIARITTDNFFNLFTKADRSRLGETGAGEQ